MYLQHVLSRTHLKKNISVFSTVMVYMFSEIWNNSPINYAHNAAGVTNSRPTELHMARPADDMNFPFCFVTFCYF